MRACPKIGKGVFIWRPQNIEKGDPAKIAAKMTAAGVQTVAIKIHNGYYMYPDIGPTIAALRAAGIQVIGWGYIYLIYNAKAEAMTAIQACQTYKIDTYLIDAEAECKNHPTEAKLFASMLRSGLPDAAIGMCSYWKPTYHPELPWKEFRSVCDFDAPQVYWRGSMPSGKLAISKKEYGAMSPKLPYAIAGGDLYLENGIKPTPDQVVEFLTAAQKTPDLKGVLMWSADQNETTPELWAAFAGFAWDPGLANEVVAFLDKAEASVLEKEAYYRNLYEEARAGKPLDLNSRDPIEAAVCAGIKALAK